MYRYTHPTNHQESQYHTFGLSAVQNLHLKEHTRIQEKPKKRREKQKDWEQLSKIILNNQSSPDLQTNHTRKTRKYTKEAQVNQEMS